MRVHDEIDDRDKRSFAAGLVFGWLTFPENADVLAVVLETRAGLAIPKHMGWLQVEDRAMLLRYVILHEAGAVRRAELTGLLRAGGATIEDVDWRLLDHQLGDLTTPDDQGPDDHAGPEH